MRCCVIGVGRFGYHVATTLADNGVEVIAVDNDETIISSVRDKVAQAICLEITDESSLRSIGVEEMDVVIVAMGENFAQSILATALLKQNLKVPRVIVRSISTIHQEILRRIGADQVVLPEQEEGVRLADSLSLSVNTLARLTPTFAIRALPAPRRFIGKSLKDLALPDTYHITCIGILDGADIITVSESRLIQENDLIVCSGNNGDLERVRRLGL